MAEPTPHVPREGRTDSVGISTAERPAEDYVPVRVQHEAAVEAAKVKITKTEAEMANAQAALTEAEAALAALPEE